MTFIDFHTHRPTAEGVITPRSFGIHPWHAAQWDPAATPAVPVDTQIIGECGLDKVCDTPWHKQMEAFEWQIRLAATLRKPMVIHCVRSFNELMELRHVWKEGLWVVHGFTGSLQLAQQLSRHDIWVSFGAAILDPRRDKVRQCLSHLSTPYLLETDDDPCGIAAIYHAAAEIRGVSISSLADTIKQTYLSLMSM